MVAAAMMAPLGWNDFSMAQQRRDQAVLGARLVVDLDLDFAVGTGELARTSKCGTSLPSWCPELSGPTAIASVSTKVPVVVVNVVSNTNVRSR
jgi:hypothetical protein